MSNLILHPTASFSQPTTADTFERLRSRPSAPPKSISIRSAVSEILFVSSFPPRECGIATYTQDLMSALQIQFDNHFRCEICALESDEKFHDYPNKPAYILQTNDINAYSKIAFRINRNPNIQLVVIQHEFGLFESHEEAFLAFMNTITKPLVLVFHTVLPAPDAGRKTYVHALSKAADAIIVMTENASRILENDYELPTSKITTIPHGTHLVPHIDREDLKKRYGFSKKRVLSTFGLLGPGKSIETTLQALPRVLSEFPDTVFLVLGKTHPSIIRTAGEQYRLQLESLVHELGLTDHVQFVNEYLPLNVLLEYLQMTDIYLFTSNDRNQAVSGTFAYAVSSGCPIVSTPIPHAKEVLANDNGIIVDFEQPAQLARAILKLLGDDKLCSQLALHGLRQMASTAWSNSALAHGHLFNTLTQGKFALRMRMPKINLNHINQLTNEFGMIQFSRLAVPNPASGYTVDDNARAMIAICQHYLLYRTKTDLGLASIYLIFLEGCLLPNGELLNYVDQARQFTLQNFTENLEDSTGRAIWALGYVSSLKGEIPEFLSQSADSLLEKLLPRLTKMHSTRAMSFAIKGLYYQNNHKNLDLLETLADRLQQMYRHEQGVAWAWFEPYLTYGNSVMPEAMLCAYLRLGKMSYRQIATESFGFFLTQVLHGSTFKAISNQGWMIRNRLQPFIHGGEQAIEVAYTILCLELFYKHFHSEHYLQQARICFEWFLGNNQLEKIMYNPATGGCYDGLEQNNVNLNQGAESTVSYLLARLALERMQSFSNQHATYRVALQKQPASRPNPADQFASYTT